ncbi:MAG: DNA integrity scanning protein DisA nucleotide-binding domain protein [Deltaproteobacteria bacterium]|nr:DNA integrity scanning protein DisA nucleotide-binding domain protein [Deltaproteobacteria bacterium]
MDIITPVQSELLRAAAQIAAKKEVSHFLYIGDLPLPDDLVKAKSTARRKLVQAVTSDAQRRVVEAMGVQTLALPTYDIARPERFKIALVSGIAKGLFKDGEVVLGIIGRGPTAYPDTLYVVTIGDEKDSVDTGFGVVGTDRIPSAILESVIDLAVDIARDGWEGRPLGTLLVVGDTPSVMEKSRQLTLNPFQGYSEAEKNILNPAVRDSIKNFAVLDGAFVIREDGVVLAAGRYLKFDDEAEFELPLGLGARHMAAAGISKDTDAIAIVVSETSGIARVFQGGTCALEIHPEQRSRRATDDSTSPADEFAEEPTNVTREEGGKKPRK